MTTVTLRVPTCANGATPVACMNNTACYSTNSLLWSHPAYCPSGSSYTDQFASWPVVTFETSSGGGGMTDTQLQALLASDKLGIFAVLMVIFAIGIALGFRFTQSNQRYGDVD